MVDLELLRRATDAGYLGTPAPGPDDVDRALTELLHTGSTQFAGLTIDLVDEDVLR